MSTTSPECSKAQFEYSRALTKDFEFDDERYAVLKKKARELGDEFYSEVLYNIQDEMHEHIASQIQQFACRAIEAVLAGDENEFRRWINADANWYTGRDRKHEVIHQKLFETGPVALRRKIVDAHPEILKTERILDLEDQLKSVTEQVAELQREMERMRDQQHR